MNLKELLDDEYDDLDDDFDCEDDYYNEANALYAQKRREYIDSLFSTKINKLIYKIKNFFINIFNKKEEDDLPF